MGMTYFGPEKRDSVRSVKDRDGPSTTYDYDFDSRDKNHHKVTAGVTAADGSKISTSSYEYFVKTTDGKQWTARMVQVIDGDVTDTDYTIDGSPAAISHNGQTTRFKYDDRGHVIYKETPTITTIMEYDPAVGKVSYVKEQSKASKETTWSKFRYDDRGNLVFAENSDKKSVTLTYDANGRIEEMGTGGGIRLHFTNNENSKPTEIREIHPDGNSDAITVTYTSSGEIERWTYLRT